MRYRYLVSCFLFSVICALYACKFNPDIQGRGADAFQGIWQEQPLPYHDSLLHYTTHRFKFTCDSFYATLSTTSKVNYYDDSCFNNGQWTEYAKGNYVVSNDTLYIIGTFTKPDFRQKLSGCYRIGQYLPVFLIRKTSHSSIELMNVQQHMPVRLQLEEKLTCNPQPL